MASPDYVLYHGIDADVRLRQPPDVDTDKLAIPLSYLYHVHLAPPELARARCRIAMLTCASFRRTDLDHKVALDGMPPAHQGLSAPGGVRRRRRRRGSAVSHHRCLYRRQDRLGDGSLLSALHAGRGVGQRGDTRMTAAAAMSGPVRRSPIPAQPVYDLTLGSPYRAAWRLASYVLLVALRPWP